MAVRHPNGKRNREKVVTGRKICFDRFQRRFEMSVGGIHEIVGKTIERVIIKRADKPGIDPKMQVFLVFADFTYFELWGDSIDAGDNTSTGDRDWVVEGENPKSETIYEAYVGEDGEPEYILYGTVIRPEMIGGRRRGEKKKR